jgi:hypothetical protein
MYLKALYDHALGQDGIVIWTAAQILGLVPGAKGGLQPTRRRRSFAPAVLPRRHDQG